MTRYSPPSLVVPDSPPSRFSHREDTRSSLKSSPEVALDMLKGWEREDSRSAKKKEPELGISADLDGVDPQTIDVERRDEALNLVVKQGPDAR